MPLDFLRCDSDCLHLITTVLHQCHDAPRRLFDAEECVDVLSLLRRSRWELSQTQFSGGWEGPSHMAVMDSDT